MWSARQSRKMGRRVAGLLGGLLVGLLLVAAPAAAFVDPINLSNSPSVSSGRPGIAVNGAGQVFVVWEEGANILFTRSQASCGGLKFEEAPRMLSAGTGTASKPAVAVNDSGGVFVVWQGQQPLANSEVWFNQSTDNGVTFLTDKGFSPVNLSQNTSPSNAPSVAADNARRVFVAWSNGSPSEILFVRSTDSGQSFGSAINVSGTPSNSTAPSVAADGSNVYLAWEDTAKFPFSIRYNKIRLTDLVVVASANLSAGLGNAISPSLAFGDGMLSVAFVSFTGPSVYHRSSSDGTNFTPLPTEADANLSGAIQFPGNGFTSRAARRNGSAMVAWSEELAGNAEIRYRLLGNGAMVMPDTFAPTPGRSASPAVAIDSTDRLLVAWQETVNLNGVLNDEIYVSYSGGTGGGTEMKAEVWSAPRHVNPQTMGPGSMRRPNLTVFIEPSEGQNWSVYDIYPGSVRLNSKEALGPTAIGDSNGNGKPDMMVKFDRGDLGAVAPGELEYPVTGDTKLPDGSRGCPFRGNGKVQIMP